MASSSSSSLSVFYKVEQNKALPEAGQVWADYKTDESPLKVLLAVGAYRTDEGKPWVLPVVRSVEAKMATDPLLDHEYLPVSGLPSFRSAATQFLLGKDSIALKEKKVTGVQTVSGTGAVRVGAEFLKRFYNTRSSCATAVYISDPSWDNHETVYRAAGFTDIRKYRYWDSLDLSLHFKGMIDDLSNAPMNSIVILHPCSHNPTGCDPTKEQWKEIAQVLQARSLFPVFDCAYQGFATGDPDADAWPVRHFVRLGFELIVCQSFSKNFGLYNERCGNLVVVMNNEDAVTKVQSQIEKIVSCMYLNPVNHGARVVSTILNDESLTQEWLDCIAIMSGRIQQMRKALYSKLKDKGTPGTWEHLLQQIGMFNYTGLNRKQVNFLRSKHIYMLSNSRISLAGLNTNNIDYFVDCLHQAVLLNEAGQL